LVDLSIDEQSAFEMLSTFRWSLEAVRNCLETAIDSLKIIQDFAH
jgi:hypothetical protein